MRLFNLFALFCVAIASTCMAQTTPPPHSSDISEYEEEERLAYEAIDHWKQRANTVVESFNAPCDQPWDFAFKAVNFHNFSRVRINSSFSGKVLIFRNNEGRRIGVQTLSGPVHEFDLDKREDINVFTLNNCGEETMVGHFSTLRVDMDQPLTLNKKDYTAILDWQKSGIDFNSFLVDYPKIDHLSKLYLLQSTVLRGADLSSDYLSGKNLPPSPKVPGTSFDKMDDCQCRNVTLSVNSTMSPIQGTYSNGIIFGTWGNNEGNGDTFEDGTVRVNTYWAYEGPSKYQELIASTVRNRCVSSDLEYYWNANGVSERDPNISAVGEYAQIDFNWLCFNQNGVASECDCDRQLNFEYEYESYVGAQASIVNGGVFCGSGRSAYAAALDNVEVVYSEINDPASAQSLIMMINAQSSDCNQRYEGPTPRDFLEFSYNLFLLTQGAPERDDFTPAQQAAATRVWRDNLVGDVIDQIDNALAEPWLIRTPCRTDIVPRRRNLTQVRNGITNFSVTLKQNKAARIVLGTTSELQAAGLRRWRANATVRSSFRLAGMMEGGGSLSPDTDCCSPRIGTWMFSTIADDLPGASTERTFERATEAFFSRNAFTVDINRETGWHATYAGFPCPAPINILVVQPLTEGTFEDYFRVAGVGDNIRIEVESIKLQADLLGSRLRLFNLAGQSVTNEQTLTEVGSLRIPSAHLPTGIYLLSAFLPNGRAVTKKIIIQ